MDGVDITKDRPLEFQRKLYLDTLIAEIVDTTSAIAELNSQFSVEELNCSSKYLNILDHLSVISLLAVICNTNDPEYFNILIRNFNYRSKITYKELLEQVDDIIVNIVVNDDVKKSTLI